ncbi:MAG: hypothetical protein AAB592_02330 [Patescibacteria group bacterium]
MKKLTELSDKKLLTLCRRYGANAILWRRKFEGLLPEVYRRELFKCRGCFSIFEFAAKYAGMNREQVQRILNLDRQLSDRPVLREMFMNGSVSSNKLRRVISVANSDTELFWAAQVSNLSHRAVETLVRDEKNAYKITIPQMANDGMQQIGGGKSAVGLFGHVPDDLGLSVEVQSKLRELKEKGIDINEVLMELLTRREREIEREKQKIAENEEKKTVAGVKAPRYISANIRKVIQKEHGKKCSMPNCLRDADHLHHTQRFSMSRNHNPNYIAPLCREHHEIAHRIDQKFGQKFTDKSG